MATHTRVGWVKRVRQLVLDGEESSPPPDHRAYIRADHSMCCPYHETHSFHEHPANMASASFTPVGN